MFLTNLAQIGNELRAEFVLTRKTGALSFLTYRLRVHRRYSQTFIGVILSKTSKAANSEINEGLDPNRWRTLFVVAISQLMVVLDSSIVNIAIPHAKHDLHI